MNGLADNLEHDFRDKDYRHGYVDGFLNSSIATQIKVLREQRGWTQEDLAGRADMKQTSISRIENVNYSSWSISTLNRLAEAFDLTLRVTFEGFGTRLLDIRRFSRETLERHSFEDDPSFKGKQEKELFDSLTSTKPPKPSIGKQRVEEPRLDVTDLPQRKPDEVPHQRIGLLGAL